MNNLLMRVMLGDPTAADELDIMSNKLKEIAGNLRKKSANPYVINEGIVDRVKMQVVNQEGKIIQQVDTLLN